MLVVFFENMDLQRERDSFSEKEDKQVNNHQIKRKQFRGGREYRKSINSLIHPQLLSVIMSSKWPMPSS